MRNVKVLIVEDNVALEGRPMEARLTDAGYEVVGIAETAEEAIAVAQEKRPSVVLMDIMLPEGRLAGAKAARAIQDATGAQIVYVTGIKIEEDVVEEVRKTREFQFLTKPVSKEQLLSSVKLAGMKAQGKAVVFLCYSHRDRRFATELAKYIAPLREVGIQTWVDAGIGLGQRWKPEIERGLQSATAAVCLISIEFVNSSFIKDIELPSLLKSAALRGTLIVPVFIGSVGQSVLERTGLLAYQGINPPDDPISGWTPAKRARQCWVPLCERLRATIL